MSEIVQLYSENGHTVQATGQGFWTQIKRMEPNPDPYWKATGWSFWAQIKTVEEARTDPNTTALGLLQATPEGEATHYPICAELG